MGTGTSRPPLFPGFPESSSEPVPILSQAMRHRLSRSVTSYRASLLAWLAIFAAMLAPASADQPAATPAPKNDSSVAPRFRRVYVPADQIEQLPRHGVRYVPMDAAEFERIAAKLSSGTKTSVQPPDVEVVRAVYEATLVGDVLTDGKATLEIRDAEKDPTLLRFDSCRLPVQTPRWIQNASPTVAAATKSTDHRRCNCAAAGDDRRRP